MAASVVEKTSILPDGVVSGWAWGSRTNAANATASSGGAKRARPFSAKVSKSSIASLVSSRSHCDSVLSL